MRPDDQEQEGDFWLALGYFVLSCLIVIGGLIAGLTIFLHFHK